MGGRIGEKQYRDLEKLYCEEEKEIDNLTRGFKIRKLVDSIVRDLINPLWQEFNVTIEKNMFDGRIVIDKDKTILYTIYIGDISETRYPSILDMIRTTEFPGTTYFLFIGHSFSDLDKKTISGLTREIDKTKVRMCFLDYKALISLHKYSSKIQIDHADGELKPFKGLFLERLLGLDLIISQKLCNDVCCSAMKHFYLELQKPLEEYKHTSEPKMSEQRLQNLERMLLNMLGEVRAIKAELFREREQREAIKKWKANIE